MHSRFIAAFLLAFCALAWNIQNVGLASGVIDPLGDVGAQDEAVYASESIQMARGGDWTTQRFAGRWELSKPPLLMWLTAFAIRCFGPNNTAFRLAALISGALCAAALFAWGVSARNAAAGACGALLIVANPLVFILSRRNLTDMIVASAATVAMWRIARDPRIERASTLWLTGLAWCAAVLDKSILGALPVAAWLASMLFWRAADRPPLRRVAAVVALAVVPGLCWAAYQWQVHHDYFLGEMRVIYGQAQGLRQQTSHETQVGFYAARIAMVDPVLTLFAVTGIYGFLRALQRREPAALLILCWLAVFAVALLAFRFRSASYLVPAVPAFAALAMLWSPLLQRRAAVAVLCVVLVVKAVSANPKWGISYAAASAPTANTLSDYCEMHRDTDLFLFDTVDQLFATALPIAKLHYVWVDPSGVYFRLDRHLATLGILVTSADYDTLPLRLPEWQANLRKASITDDLAIGTGIALRDARELSALFQHNQQSDFLIPVSRLALLPDYQATHETRRASPDRVLLLARQPSHHYQPQTGWACRF